MVKFSSNPGKEQYSAPAAEYFVALNDVICQSDPKDGGIEGVDTEPWSW